jgi:dephospho-CoA kinase
MTEAKLAAIIAKQLPDADKRRRADLILDTSLGHDEALRQVRKLINNIRAGRVTAIHHA